MTWSSRARVGPFAFSLALAALPATVPSNVEAQAKGAPVQQSKVSRGQVVERCGTAGDYTIGKTLTVRSERAAGDNQFAAPDGTIVTTNARRAIAEIRIVAAGAFTQRYVVNRETTLNDVLKRYGPAQVRRQRASRPDSREFVLEYAYEGISFAFGGVPATLTVSGSVAAQFDRPVSAIIVHEKERDPSGRDHSCNLK